MSGPQRCRTGAAEKVKLLILKFQMPTRGSPPHGAAVGVCNLHLQTQVCIVRLDCVERSSHQHRVIQVRALMLIDVWRLLPVHVFDEFDSYKQACTASAELSAE